MVFYLAGNLFCIGVNFSRLLTGSYKGATPVIGVVTLAMAVSSLFISTPTEATHLVLNLFNPLDLSYSFVVINLSILLTLIISRIRRQSQSASRQTEGP